jgi:hypothetical protein
MSIFKSENISELEIEFLKVTKMSNRRTTREGHVSDRNQKSDARIPLSCKHEVIALHNWQSVRDVIFLIIQDEEMTHA